MLECVNGDAALDAVIFAGTGTTGAIDILSCILGCEWAGAARCAARTPAVCQLVVGAIQCQRPLWARVGTPDFTRLISRQLASPRAGERSEAALGPGRPLRDSCESAARKPASDSRRSVRAPLERGRSHARAIACYLMLLDLARHAWRFSTASQCNVVAGAARLARVAVPGEGDRGGRQRQHRPRCPRE